MFLEEIKTLDQTLGQFITEGINDKSFLRILSIGIGLNVAFINKKYNFETRPRVRIQEYKRCIECSGSSGILKAFKAERKCK